MKKYRILLMILVTIFIATFVATCFVACDLNGGKSNINGTYYMYRGNTKVPSRYLVLKNGTWKDESDQSGRYEVNGNNIMLYIEFFGSEEEYLDGTVGDGVLALREVNVVTYYCKDGATPPSSDEQGGSPDTTIKRTITYDANGGLFGDGNERQTEQVDNGSKLTAPTSPSRTNYTFAGWSKKKNSSDMWKFDTDTVTEDTTLYAQWTQKSAVVLSVDGASMENETIYMFVEHDVDSVPLTDKVVCSDDSTWKLYYDKMGQQPIPTKVAAQMNGFLNNGSNVFYILVSSQNGAQENLYELTIYRSFEVPVRYYDGLQVIQTDSCYTGHEYVADYTPNITGYTFNYWTNDGVQYQTTKIWGALDLTANKTAKKYDVTFDVNKGNALSEENQSKTVTYGSVFDLPVPTRTGYSFVGWYSGSTQITKSNGSGLVEWNIPNSTKLTAHWQANEYDLSVKASNSSAGTVTGGGTYAYDSTVTLTAETNNGYTWVGWFDGDTKLSDEFTFKYTMGLAKTIIAKWSKATITSNITSAGSITSLTGKYLVGDTDTVTASTNVGYTWVGWFNGTKKLTDEYELEIEMTDTDVTYIAQFEMVKEMENFVFTSTPTTCKITGVKNTAVTEITIPEYVTDIGYNAFVSCTKLAIVNWNATNCSLNDNKIFQSVTNLATVNIGANVTAIPGYAFYNCSSLSTVTFAEGSLLQSIGNYAFEYCNDLQEITIPENVISIGNNAFASCTNLATVNWNAINCTPVGMASNIFEGCTNLTMVNIGANVFAIPGFVFHDCDSLQEITISASVMSIDAHAFCHCSNLKMVNIAENSLLQVIDSYAFEYCSSLQEITIPENVTSIGDNAFANCTNLAIVNWNATKCKSVGEYEYSSGRYNDYTIFKGCTNLTTVNIGANVTSIPAYTFYNCSGLQEITIPASVTSIGEYAFRDCSSLQEITIPASVTYIGSYAFYKCSSLNRVNISDIDAWCDILFGNEWANPLYYAQKLYLNGELATSLTISTGTTSIGRYAFYNCSSLQEITIPASVTSIYACAFSNCSSLQEITIPENVTSIGYDAFYHCSNLKTVNIAENSLLRTIDSCAFYNCSSLQEINIPASVTSIGSSAFYGCSSLQYNTADGVNYLGNDDNNYLVLVSVSDKNRNSYTIQPTTRFIYDRAFENCTSLQEITIPENVTSIGDNAFANCTNLATVNWNATNCTSVGTYYSSSRDDTIFKGCTNLTTVNIGANVTFIPAYVFYGRSLQEITIPASVTSIGEHAFYDCSNLKTVNIAESSLLRYIGDRAFYNCSSLQEITIPENVTDIGDNAFANCTNLATVNWNATFCAFVGTYSSSSDDTIFKGCTNLTTVNIGANVTFIPEYTFYKCSYLTTVTFDGESLLQTIGDYAFSYCTRLQEITIPASVTSIGDWAFYNCSSLKAVYYGGNQTQWGKIQIEGNNGKLTGATRYYYSANKPDGSELPVDNYWRYVDGKPTVWKEEDQ